MSKHRKLDLLQVYFVCSLRFAVGIIKGISYSPLPLKSSAGIGELYQDDWMVQEARPMWGERGREDLHVISQLGANMVRLYGNNPELNHRDFLDVAHKEGLQVSPGFSDYPYFQMPVGNCRSTQYNCYNQTRAMYSSNLRNGFLTSSQTYHPALRYFFLINEPDLKMPPEATFGSPEAPRTMAKAILSAFDGALDAEKDLGVVGDLINFTVSFSFAICSACQRFKDKPALGQIATIEDAMFHPESYGYYSNNNLTDAYLKRWTHCFNTNNPARDLRPLFLDIYEATFSSTPFFIGEYHSQYVSLSDDLSQVLTLAATSSLFLGISFFEYQVAYWKGGSEEGFGLD